MQLPYDGPYRMNTTCCTHHQTSTNPCRRQRHRPGGRPGCEAIRGSHRPHPAGPGPGQGVPGRSPAPQLRHGLCACRAPQRGFRPGQGIAAPAAHPPTARRRRYRLPWRTPFGTSWGVMMLFLWMGEGPGFTTNEKYSESILWSLGLPPERPWEPVALVCSSKIRIQKAIFGEALVFYASIFATPVHIVS